jgi:hypothetical protein
MKDIVIGTLCWFWDGDEDERVIGLYRGTISEGKRYVWYWTDSDIPYGHCRPVKRNEIQLEEDE